MAAQTGVTTGDDSSARSGRGPPGKKAQSTANALAYLLAAPGDPTACKLAGELEVTFLGDWEQMLWEPLL